MLQCFLKYKSDKKYADLYTGVYSQYTEVYSQYTEANFLLFKFFRLSKVLFRYIDF